VPIVKVSDFTQDSVSPEKVAFIPIESSSDFEKYKLEKGDVLIQTVGSWEHNPNSVVGKVVRIPEVLNDSLLNQNIVKIIPKETLDKSFLFYLLKSDAFKGYIIKTAQGAANQASITLESIKAFKFTYKDKTTQRKIASILSAYDDLIENNLKRIKLLEEKAQLHYKELIQDSTKWDKVRLEEFVSVVKGRKPANILEHPEEESQLYLLLDTVERNKTLYTTDLSLPQSKNTDVLMCMDGARSGLSFRGMDGAIGSTMAIWRSNSERVSGEFLYQFMKQNESAITQGNTGAAIPHANRKFILDMKMAIPPKKEADNFDSLTLPMIKLINTFHNQNAKLREARDILLPKLMNGQIEV
jgi:type I restriction enzyme S subunit